MRLVAYSLQCIMYMQAHELLTVLHHTGILHDIKPPCETNFDCTSLHIRTIDIIHTELPVDVWDFCNYVSIPATYAFTLRQFNYLS